MRFKGFKIFGSYVLPISPDARKISEHIAARLIALRKGRGLKQADLVLILGVKVAQISKYETGDSLITLDNLMKAAKYFDVSIGELLPPTAISINIKKGVADAAAPFLHDASVVSSDNPVTEATALATDFVSIRSPDIRASVAAHVRALANANV
jgi:transcriptional regulator with XRE-family HTH domain